MWRYEGALTEELDEYENRMQWLRQVLGWREEGSDVSELSKELFSEVILDRIYVYTPDGHVIDMNPGSTPVDFAYRVHPARPSISGCENEWPYCVAQCQAPEWSPG